MSVYAQNLKTRDSLKQQLEIATGKERVDILNKLSFFKPGDSEGAKKAQKHSTEAKKLAREIKYESGFIEALTLQGTALGNLGLIEQGIDTLKKALSLSLENKDAKLLASVYFALGSEYERNEEFAFSLEAYKNAYSNYIIVSDSLELGYVCNNIANVYFHSGDYTNALKYYLTALQIKQKTSKEELSKTYGNIALVYKTMENYSKALEYSLKAVQEQEKSGSLFPLSISYLTTGNIYKGMANTDSAKYYYDKAMAISKEIDDEIGVGIAFFSIGNITYKAGKYNEAIGYYEKAKEIFDHSGVTSYIIMANLNMAIVYYDMNELKKARDIAIKAYELSENSQVKETKKQLTKVLYQIFKKQGDSKRALEFHEKYFAYQDSLLNEQKVTEIARLETNFEIKQRDNEIKILNKTQEMSALQIREINNTRIFLLITTLLLLVVAAAVFNSYRIKNKSEKELSTRNEQMRELNAAKDKFFAIIAHDIRNPLSAFRSLSRTLSENHENLTPELLQKYLNNLNKSSESLIELLKNLLQWALSQTHQLQHSPKPTDLKKIIQQNINLLGENAKQKSIQIETSWADENTAYVDEATMDIVFRNLISNALKFTDVNGKIHLGTKLFNSTISVSIEDNGIGMSENDLKKLFDIGEDTSSIGDSMEKGTGLGLLLCKEYVDQNNGQISVFSELGKGSKFIVELPTVNKTKVA
ncbi:MAG: tetratricopeptide repeat protein [Cyclobacteriaceae bacterium]|nr:tetratricopeptide repeat protein [Cyclobacteriaceae bacterium]